MIITRSGLFKPACFAITKFLTRGRGDGLTSQNVTACTCMWARSGANETAPALGLKRPTSSSSSNRGWARSRKSSLSQP
eukprot:3608473-Karenia_brevis.AAC.1